MKSNEIAKSLLINYHNSRPIHITNYSGCGLHEADVLMMTNNNMLYEYEIKCSLSDFKADFKKIRKHEILQGWIKTNPYVSVYGDVHDEQWYLDNIGTAGRPNYFYYACKNGLIPESLIPKHAGLVYVNESGTINIIKKAPKLHSHKCTSKFIERVCKTLSGRMLFGSSFKNYMENERDISTIDGN